MRFYKLILVTLLLGTLLIASVIYARSTVVTSLLNNYLSQHQSAITCIDFSVNAEFDLVISRLCVDSPYADIELNNIVVNWRFDINNLQKEKLSEAISSVNIAKASVQAKGRYKLPDSKASAPYAFKEIPQQVRQNLVELSSFSSPITIDIKRFVYLPSREQNIHQRLSYFGHVSINSQQASLSLITSENNQIIDIKVTKQESFKADISIDLPSLKNLLMSHQAILPTSVETQLSSLGHEQWVLQGKIDSQIEWHKQTLKVKSQLTGFSLSGVNNLLALGIAELKASLNWQLTLAGEVLQIAFNNTSNLVMPIEQKQLLKSLRAFGLDDSTSEILNSNPIDSIALAPIGTTKLDFDNLSINSDGIKLISQNLAEPFKFSVNNIAASIDESPILSAEIQQAHLSASGLLKLPQFQAYSNDAVKFKVHAKAKQLESAWQLQLLENSSIQLSNIAVVSEPEINKVKSDEQAIQARLKTLTSDIQGEITIAKPSTFSKQGALSKQSTHTKQSTKGAFSFQLQNRSRINNLEFPGLIQFDEIEIHSQINGILSDITVTTEVIADKLPLVNARITGNIAQPSISLLAQDLLITDLLALKAKVPAELSLIDGRLSYQLSGQVKNSSDLLKNPMQLTVSVEDVTGEIEGTWIQELNWQQNFIAQDGQIKSMLKSSEASNNLTIAKIEIATPITDFTTATNISFVDNEVQIQLGKAQGNFLGGEFSVEGAQWPFNKEQPVAVRLTEIDLEKLLELDQKQGIVITGRVSGELPIFYDGEHFLIEGGHLYNVGEGLIQVFDNPAVEELKTTNTQLKLAFDALENLHYYQLKSDVSMANDGYMLLVTAIKGKNPDLDNDVNLNLNLSYDLLGLLESLNITEHFEEKFIKGLQPN